jgi:hypothetical protein
VGGSCSPVTRRTSTSARNDAMCLLHDSMSDDEVSRSHQNLFFISLLRVNFSISFLGDGVRSSANGRTGTTTTGKPLFSNV